jgi:acyl phosphate:glycerol-3-phosphate acyltransferase
MLAYDGCYNAGQPQYKDGEIACMFELGFKVILAYFIGSIMGSMAMGKLRGGIDIRTMGSGNAGGTNALRTQGLLFAAGVVVIDIGKGIVAAGVIPGIQLPIVGNDPDISRTWLTLCCAAASVVGHVWPMWHNFRGGKGAATLVGTFVILAPKLIVPVILIWAWVLVLSGFVGLATMIAAISAPIYLAVRVLPSDQPLFIYCVVLALYIVFTHRSNIRRMMDGTEARNPQLMIFRREKR